MRISLPFVIAILLYGPAAAAQTGVPVPPAPNMLITSAKPPVPQRELDYIAIIDKARKQYLAARSIDGRRDARVAMQIAVVDFMKPNNIAQDWVGVFKDNARTNDGRVSLEIEIAPNVRIATWSNATADQSYNTLFQPYSELGKTASSFAIGDEIVFSGIIFGSLIANDDDMVLHPQLIARFRKLAKRAPAEPPK